MLSLLQLDKEEIMLVSNPLVQRPWVRDAIKSVSNGWWALFFSGIVSIVAGALILLIHWTVADLAVFLGALLICRGIFTMFSLPLDGTARGWAIGLGLLEAAVGIAVLVWPGPTLLVIAAFIGFWVLFNGVITITGSVSARRILPYWGLFLGLGVVETILSFWLLSRPGLTLVATVLAIGLWSLIYGVILTIVAVDLKNLPARLERDLQQPSNTSLTDSRPRVSRAS
jgi:uncharacterized membrane protein HdeD (DUF308 family)